MGVVEVQDKLNRSADRPVLPAQQRASPDIRLFAGNACASMHSLKES